MKQNLIDAISIPKDVTQDEKEIIEQARMAAANNDGVRLLHCADELIEKLGTQNDIHAKARLTVPLFGIGQAIISGQIGMPISEAIDVLKHVVIHTDQSGFRLQAADLLEQIEPLTSDIENRIALNRVIAIHMPHGSEHKNRALQRGHGDATALPPAKGHKHLRALEQFALA